MKRIVNDPAPLTAKINVTPIIDVSLTLVIILLITAPMLAVPDVEIKLPSANTRGADCEVRVSVTVGRNDELAINETRVRPQLFAATLRAILSKDVNKNALVVVRADRDAPFAMVRMVLSEARSAGAGRLAIATLQGDTVN